MAKIIQTDLQNKALTKIKANLKSIENINRFLELHTGLGFISFSFGGNALKLPLEKKAADAFAKGLRRELTAEIIRLSKTNSIELSSEEIDMLQRMPKKGESQA